MKIGIRAHDLGCDTAENLARAGSDLGIQAIQLAPGKALLPAIEPGHLNAQTASEIARTFSAAGIEISVLGCYINPIHPDYVQRKFQLARFRESLRFASDFGCSVVATESGSFRSDCGFHPDNRGGRAFSILMESLSELADYAAPYGICIGIEPALEHVIHDVDQLQRALETLDSEFVKVIFDPVNLMEAKNLPAQRFFFDRSLGMLGDKIAALHAKDFLPVDGALARVSPGRGLLDYSYLLSAMKRSSIDVPIIMEETSGAHISGALAYLRDMTMAQ